MSARIADIPGVCIACTQRLATAGIHTLDDLRKAEPQVVLERVSVVCMAALGIPTVGAHSES